MTRFEKDVKEIQEGNEVEVLKKRTDSEDSALHRSMREDWLNMKNWMP